MTRGGKDAEKPVEPLFPRLHIDDINDAVKGGPRPPPRNKMALCERYNTPSQPSFPKLHDISDAIKGGPMPPTRNKTTVCEQYNTTTSQCPRSFGSMEMVRAQPGNGQSGFVPRSFSCQIAGPQHKVLPTFSSLPGSSHLAARDHSCYSTGVNLKTLPTNSEPRMSEPTKECNSPAPHGFNICYIRRPDYKYDFRIPSYGRPGTSRGHGDLQLHMEKEKLNTFSSISSEIPADADSPPIARNSVSQMDDKAIKSINHHKKHVSVDELSRLIDPNAEPCQEERTAIRDGAPKMSERIKRKRCMSEMDISLHSFPRPRDSIKLETTKDLSEDEDDEPVQGGNADKNQETSDPSASDSTAIQAITPDDVTAVIGERLYWKARNQIINQQRTFSRQIFELHRLIKVQRLIVESPEVLYEKNFDLNKPSTKFHSKDKLLYIAPMDPSSMSTKPKVDGLKLPPDKDCGASGVSYMLPPCIPNAGKRQLALESSPKLSPLKNAMTAPWRDQWLVPVRSPSEGLIYKLYSGPCPPPLGIMAPVLGSCGPISLSTAGGTAYGVLAPDNLGMAQTNGQPYVIPLNPSGPFPDLKQITPFAGKTSLKFDANFAVPCQSEVRRSSGISPVEQMPGDALSLFPTTPSSSAQGSNDQGNEQSIRVIKVVPHNPKAAPESAARIFQSIQEERKNR
ncbi:hypothetical protein CDL12_00282 [Handroanthus impetiginosus]|uniref:Uncharacterized protein n=1 Tax=Handroanthus impetiginosus TaxID=429701 RepID=A0A2G9IBB1_9LAMI|nr:hypothetical protein CDL12_00282 [Handroanthus impetiginosus]